MRGWLLCACARARAPFPCAAGVLSRVVSCLSALRRHSPVSQRRAAVSRQNTLPSSLMPRHRLASLTQGLTIISPGIKHASVRLDYVNHRRDSAAWVRLHVKSALKSRTNFTLEKLNTEILTGCEGTVSMFLIPRQSAELCMLSC